jgi:hypothetical protein
LLTFFSAARVGGFACARARRAGFAVVRFDAVVTRPAFLLRPVRCAIRVLPGMIIPQPAS